MNRDPLAIVQDLAELIEAIDRRSPQLQRSGESDIVEAATRLRAQAQARISELTLISRESACTNSGLPVDDEHKAINADADGPPPVPYGRA